MTTKFQEVGEVKNWTNGGSAVVSGAVVQLGCMVAVAITDIASGAVGAVKITGVFASMPKKTGGVWAVGSPLNYDLSSLAFDLATATPATGDSTNCAVAWEAALTGDTIGVVLLTPNGAGRIT